MVSTFIIDHIPSIIVQQVNMARLLSLYFPILIFVGLLHGQMRLVSSEPHVPCYFIFGDSLVDSGNNNILNTTAKVNYLPYGIDFPEGPTGRFTNGRTAADIIGQFLGFVKFIPPYVNATDQEISTGVNYGSGGAGIREESGRHLGDRISFPRQLLNHVTTISRISALHGNKTFTAEYLKKCIYLANIGSNDYVSNYFIPTLYSTSNIYTVDKYAVVLAEQYREQLTKLYNLGARKIVVFGLSQLGCIPAAIAAIGTNGKPCVDSINDAANLFNNRLKPLVDELNNDHFDAKFTFINLTSILAPEGDVPTSNVHCCLTQPGQCIPNSIPCPVRGLSTFYDDLHPTEVVNTVVATRSYIALSNMDASPYDISHLARL
ncbi:hypothetical protein L2E82_37627 [Cichorium intybus]|uniref:Uncharacterized protein n=1 Tax=Cichorium intybus TaxID=13427 RepID=A0ACB9AE19_CICIN|nr:hypothetical protein L2E82_37627 [Cichorium intybus]